MCKDYVVFYENRVNGFIGVVGFADSSVECDNLVKHHYTDERLNYDYHIVPNFPNVMHKFFNSDKFVNIRLVYDKLLLDQCFNVANWLAFADLALKKNHYKTALRNYRRALSVASDTKILDNYEF